MNYRLSAMLCTICIAHVSVAQNTTNLPTSMYGVGELSTNDGGQYAGMGNIGIALNRTGFHNTQNPAAITRMDSTCFSLDIGVMGSYARYSFLSARSSNLSGNPNRLNIGFRVLPRWYAMIGASPYSSVGYVIQTEEDIAGTANSAVYSLFEGNGGLYKFYATNAFVLSKHLSIGANIGFVSGTVTQSETQEKATVQYESSKKALYADLGIYYELSAGKRNWAAGIVYAPSTKINQDNKLTYSNNSIDERLDESYHTRAQYLPQRFGAGISMNTERWALTADYNYLDWSRNYSSYTSMKYRNQHKMNLGGIFTTNPRLPRSTELMGGVGFSNSYIMLKGGKMRYLEVSAGVSFPIRYSYLSLGVTGRKQINSHSNLMQESRLSINLNLTFGERISKSKLR